MLTEKGRETAERSLRQLVEQWTTQLQGVQSAELNDVAQALWALVPHMDPRFESG